MTSRKFFSPDNDRVETDVKREIREYLEYKGYKCKYFMPEKGNRHSKGIADMIAMKDGITTFIEAKIKGGKQDEHQKEFQRLCESAGVRYVLAYGIDDVAFLP